MRAAPQLSAFAIPDIPLIQAGDDIVDIMLAKTRAAGFALGEGDVLVVSSKIVSKAAGRLICLDAVRASQVAIDLAAETDKDPRLVELILSESEHVSRKRRGVLVTKHRLGFVSANAGIDQSNIEGGDDRALLLPINPDQAASSIRQQIQARLGIQVGVIISDSHGRPFRVGNIGVAIGAAGLPTIKDLRGSRDLYGRTLEITQIAYADLVASAAHLLCGEADEGLPVVVLRGLDVEGEPGCAADLIRSPEHDLYR